MGSQPGPYDKNRSTTVIPSRDYLFDNMRAILIILVVWGHVLTSMIFDYDPIKSIYFFLFFFHMPAMAFISGYFSKNLEKSRSNAFVTILIPYLILNVFNYVYKIYIIQEPHFGFRFFRPLWGLWYLLALFLWKFFLKDLVKLRFLLPLKPVLMLL
jgi:fucose 4-O-acetylase-like acetyltransferase